MKMGITRLGRVLLLSALFVLAPGLLSDIDACSLCKYSPNGWGFCRWGYQTGWGGCDDIIVDAYTGKTGCSYYGTCINGGDRAENDSCWWTGLFGGCVV